MKTIVLLLLLSLGAMMAVHQFSEPTTGVADPGQPVSIVSAERTPSVVPASLPLALDASTSLQDAIVARPLFARSRKAGSDAKPVAPDGAAVDGGLSEGQARLVGVILSPAMRKVLVRFGESRPEWLTEGDTIHGWRVKTVSAQQAVLSGAGGDLLLELHAPQP